MQPAVQDDHKPAENEQICNRIPNQDRPQKILRVLQKIVQEFG